VEVKVLQCTPEWYVLILRLRTDKEIKLNKSFVESLAHLEHS
jgi:hypothetical protein